ncbi:winged helix-turn-helix transcriptional regulator [Acidisoma sp. 7E03]
MGRGKKTDLSLSSCATARALNIIGDWWSLLIIQDALSGMRRFGEFKKRGIPTNVLTARLRKLTEVGVMEAVTLPDGRYRGEYRLTSEGEKLFVVVAALWQWGEKHLFAPDEQTPVMIDSATDQELAPIEVRTIDGRLVTPSSRLTTRPRVRRRTRPPARP